MKYTTWCTHCHRQVVRDPGRCGTCNRHAAIGAIVDAIGPPVRDADIATVPQLGDLKRIQLDGLDAVAHLLIDRWKLVRQHRREAFDDQRSMQADARDSYREGFAAGTMADRYR